MLLCLFCVLVGFIWGYWNGNVGRQRWEASYRALYDYCADRIHPADRADWEP